MLARLGGFLYRMRWSAIIVAMIIVVTAAIYGSSLFGLLKSGGFTDPNSQSSQAQAVLDAKLGGSSADVIILMRSDSLHVTDPAFVNAAEPVLTTLKARPEVASVTSYFSTQSSSFVARDGHETFAIVQLKAQDEGTKESDYKKIQSLITSPTLSLQVGGTVPVSIAISAQVSADLEHAEIITFPIVTILLFIVFGGLVAALLPLLIGGVAILGAFAVLHLLTNFTDISVFSINVVTMLGLGLAIDYALFIVTRFREELRDDENDVQGALRRTMKTAGRTVAFSGLTVSTSLLGLLFFPEVFLRSMGIGAIAAILVVLVASLTILPVILALLGRRVNALSLRRLLRRSTRANQDTHGAWYRLSQGVMRWPVPVALGVLAILLLLGTPFLHINFSTTDVRVLPASQPARVVSDTLSSDFTQQGNSQIVIAVRTPGNALSAANLANLDSYIHDIQAIPGVEQVNSLVTVSPALSLAQYQQLYAHPNTNAQLTAVAAQLAGGDATKVTVEMQPAERSTATETIVRQVRAIQAPGGLVALVDGITPEQMDLLASLAATIPYALLVIAVAVFILLFLMTGSVVIPIKAILLNILSLTATFGGLVWIFQDGHLQNLLNFQSLGSIDATQPVLIFAIAFGLSMDYEVFLLSRIKERYDETGNNREAVATGLQRTGWLITSAALLLAVVLGAFGGSKIISIQEIGIGLAIAVIIDATLVRMLLVPAFMRLLGRWNWWAPAPLQAIWKRIGFSETPVHAVPTLVATEPIVEEKERATV
ncbi:MAG TPA: MMPL family transporter [Ktedonobacteraceae bacterium]|nr:MMPL family transporter [Ktedonobacteraceae bacterium]